MHGAKVKTTKLLVTNVSVILYMNRTTQTENCYFQKQILTFIFLRFKFSNETSEVPRYENRENIRNSA
jgi:glutaredoxin-related protein